MWNSHGGSELRTLALYKGLQARGVNATIWSTHTPAHALQAAASIHPIDTESDNVPHAAIWIIVGLYFSFAPWIQHAAKTRRAPRKIFWHYNTDDPRYYRRRIREIPSEWRTRVTLVFPSEVMRTRVGLPGIVEYSPIDISRFAPRDKQPHRFTMGRLGRDTRSKHHWRDPHIYISMARSGAKIRLMGASRWQKLAQRLDSLEILPPGREPAEEFLHSLDVFFFRTSRRCFETYGRVVAEAMACGLPVVVANRGGYTDLIQHGDNGFVFKSNQEALSILHELQQDSALRCRIGNAARTTIETLYNEEAIQASLDRYLA